MRDILAVVTDLDGTVADEAGRISAATVQAATDLVAARVPFIIATARTSAWVADAGPLVGCVAVAVCCGGAVGWSPTTDELLWRDTIAPASVERIMQRATRLEPVAGIAAFDGRLWRVTSAFAEHGPTRRGRAVVVTAGEIGGQPVCAMSIWHPTGSGELFREVAGAEPDLSVANNGAVVDIGPAGCDKASGVLRALAVVGIDPARTVAFGDMPNDLPMFALCGHRVAVANAHPQVLAAASMVTACVHRDGFARALGHFGLVRHYPVRADTAEPGCACPAGSPSSTHV